MKLIFLLTITLTSLAFAADTDWFLVPGDTLTTNTISTGDNSTSSTRRVSWFNYIGLSIVNGDEIFGSVDDLLDVVIPGNGNSTGGNSTSGNGTALFLSHRPCYRLSVGRAPQSRRLTSRAFSLSAGDAGLWSNGTIDYLWADQASQTAKQTLFEQAISAWTTKLPWLKFNSLGVGNGTTAGGPVVVHSVDDFISAGTVGRSARSGGNHLILGAVGPATSQLRVYIRQIGHTLGLFDEHQRPDRYQHYTLDCTSVRCSRNSTGGPCVPASCEASSCTGYGCFFASQNGYNASGAYDVSSVMQIPTSSFKGDNATTDPLQSVATTKFSQKIKFGPKPQFEQKRDDSSADLPSGQDAARVCALYGAACSNVCGNGVVETGEQCDDGNNVSGDGCSSTCQLENNNNGTSPVGPTGTGGTGTGSTPRPTGFNSTTSPFGTGTGVPTTPFPTSSNSTSVFPTNPTAPPSSSSSLTFITISSSAPSTPTTSSPTSSSLPPTTTSTTSTSTSTSTSSISVSTTSSSSLTPTETPSPGTCPITECKVEPPNNPCAVRGSCVTDNEAGKSFCFCQAGYKPAAGAVGYRLDWPGQDFRVAVNPGVQCDELCGDNLCSEVTENYDCL